MSGYANYSGPAQQNQQQCNMIDVLNSDSMANNQNITTRHHMSCKSHLLTYYMESEMNARPSTGENTDNS